MRWSARAALAAEGGRVSKHAVRPCPMEAARHPWGAPRPAEHSAVCPDGFPPDDHRAKGASPHLGPALAIGRGMRRLLAIGFIWLCCAIAWTVLGSVLHVRSSDYAAANLGEVRALWGPALAQVPPSATGSETHKVKRKERNWDEKHGKYVDTEWLEDQSTTVPVTLAGSDLDAALSLEHRRKGLLWFPTYQVTFAGRYALRNDTAEARDLEVTFPIEAGVTYDGFEVRGPDGKPLEAAFAEGGAHFRGRLAAGETQLFTVSYKARGVERWTYGAEGRGLGPEVGRARDFTLTVKTDFPNVDFPAGSLSPSAHAARAGGWSGTWSFGQLVSTATVAVELPRRLNPGPLAAKITYFAPVSLLFFFFVTGMALAARRRSIHPMNYFLLGCAFFAFHLLFAYLIDHLEIAASFTLASAVSVLLVVTYARLFVGWRTALLTFGVAQLLYLVLFSFTFFWDGYTGLAITVGAILTLFVIMQLTGKLDWAEVLRRPQVPTLPDEQPLPTRPA